VVDVRRPGEWQAGHIASAVHLPLNNLAQNAGELPKDQPLALICAGGFRSSIATSILERQGFTKVTNVVGGMAAWRGANLEVAA
jgi:hydroxyacylglutathione hydrolase